MLKRIAESLMMVVMKVELQINEKKSQYMQLKYKHNSKNKEQLTVDNRRDKLLFELRSAYQQQMWGTKWNRPEIGKKQQICWGTEWDKI